MRPVIGADERIGPAVALVGRNWARFLEGENEQPMVRVIDRDPPVQHVPITIGLGPAPGEGQAWEDEPRSPVAPHSEVGLLDPCGSVELSDFGGSVLSVVLA